MTYVLLWLLEGALRKWGPGSLGSALYFFRDGLMLLSLLVFSIRLPPIRRTPPVLTAAQSLIVLLAMIQMITSTLPQQVAIVGIRQFVGPLVFIHFCIRYVSMEQAHRICSLLLAFVPIECLLSLAQVLSPAGSWINAVGPGEYTSFFTAGGVVRASGTFTAAYGLVCYLMIASAIGLARQANRRSRSIIERTAVPLMLLTCLISGSRSAIIFAAIAIAGQALFALTAVEGSSRRALVRTLAAIVLGTAVAVWAAPGVLFAFQERAANAEQTQSTSDRLRLQAFRFDQQIPKITPLGDGLGSHSAGGIAAGSNQDWIEDELGRWMREAGFLGVIAVLAREIAVPFILYKGFQASRTAGSSQCFLFCCVLAPSLTIGLVNTQPSQQGFTAIAGAFAILDVYAGKGIHK